MKYLLVDASLNGTGIRDYYGGGYIDPEDLLLSSTVIESLRKWLKKYEEAHYDGFKNDLLISELDNEGREIAYKIKKELSDVKMEYYSDARMTKDQIT